MENLKMSIDAQIVSNRGKNLFHDGISASNEFIELLVDNLKDINNLSSQQEDELISYTTDKVFQEFCRINQYYSFGQPERQELKNIYAELFSNIKNSNSSIAALSETHFTNLRNFIYKTNPFAGKIYPQMEEDIQPVACSEYTSELQIEIFQLNIADIMEPVLDIGCGRQGNMVKYLRARGIEAYGFDRLPSDLPFLTTADWLEYQYGVSRWGSIISNLGFSNHFIHHNLREDGNYLSYAEKYMEILRSLKPGGCFYYAPGLPFIEQHLNRNRFQVSTMDNVPNGPRALIIKRLI
jgi:SAM-dependent methyltransferase